MTTLCQLLDISHLEEANATLVFCVYLFYLILSSISTIDTSRVCGIPQSNEEIVPRVFDIFSPPNLTP